jgi:hypothetical protein
MGGIDRGSIRSMSSLVSLILSSALQRRMVERRQQEVSRGMKASPSGGRASMSAVIPCTLAAKYVQTGPPVTALVRDGAMRKNKMAELIVVAEYWREWRKHQWIVCGSSDGEVASLAREAFRRRRKMHLGAPKVLEPRVTTAGSA